MRQPEKPRPGPIVTLKEDIKVSYKRQLDAVVARGCACGDPTHHGESPAFFHPSCHMHMPVLEVSYTDGVMRLSCPLCDKTVLYVAIASEPLNVN